jgi:hypothetical protein
MSVDVSEIAPVTLADVMSRVRTLPNLGERRRQDLWSAVRLVCRALGRRPEEIPADPQRLRVWLTAISATEAGVGEARWRNGKSLFDSALEAAGIAMIRKRSKEPMTDLWTDLLQKISDRYIKARLTRLARFCTGRQSRITSTTSSWMNFAMRLRATAMSNGPNRCTATLVSPGMTVSLRFQTGRSRR